MFHQAPIDVKKVVREVCSDLSIVLASHTGKINRVRTIMLEHLLHIHFTL